MTASIEKATASALALAAALASAPAMAQEAGGEAQVSSEIIVTAQRREEASRDVPISVTSLGQDQLATANVRQLSDTAKLTPGLRFDSQGPAVQPTIRGVGTAITTSGGGPNVGIYVDGFFQANTYLSDFDLLNVRNIQVLKGPQGTLFGRNTTGGAILVTTAEPSTDTSAQARVSYGRFNALKAQAYATYGISDRVALDIEGLYRRGDGHFTDISNGDDEIGAYENWSLRLGLKADLTDDVSLLLRWIHAETDDPTTQLVNAFIDRSGDAGFFDKVSPAGQAIYGRSSSQGLPLVYFFAPSTTFATKPGDVLLNKPLSFRTNSDALQATIKADLGFADLTSYSQYRKDLSPYFGDLDATAIPMFNLFVGVEDVTWSQEFLLNSKPGGPLQWTAGLNYFEIRDTWDVDASFLNLPFFDFGGSSTKTTSYAAFLDMTYEFSDRFFVTVGGRYSHDIVSDAYFTINPFTIRYIGPDGEPVENTFPAGTQVPVDTLKNDSFTPRFVVRYKPSEESSIYASYTKGYKAGILNVGGLSHQPVKPEKINAFEVGYKFANSVLQADFAGFYYDYKNLQVSSFQSGAAQIRNAASSEIYGAEAQLRYKVSSDFSVNGGVSWTHARYKKFPNAPYYSYCDPNPTVADDSTNPMNCAFSGARSAGGIVQTTTDASGFKMQRAPEFTGNIGASYGLDLGGGRLMLSGNLYYTSSFYFDPEQQFKQKGYELLSLRAEWTDPSDTFTVAAFGDNVTNSRYQTQVLFTTLGTGAVWNSPTTYGVELGVKFR